MVTDIDRSLDSLYPAFKEQILNLNVLLKANNLPAYPFETNRSFERSSYLYSLGRSYDDKTKKWKITNKKLIVSNALGGTSYHNYGLGCDFVFDGDEVKPGIQWFWNKPKSVWNKVGKLGEQIGLVWGGSFKSIQDLPHFQYRTKYKVTDLLAFYNQGGLPKVWSKLDEERGIKNA